MIIFVFSINAQSYKSSECNNCTSSFCRCAENIISGEMKDGCIYNVDMTDENINRFFEGVFTSDSGNERLIVFNSLCDILSSIKLEDSSFFKDLKRDILFKENTTLLNLSKYPLKEVDILANNYEQEKKLFFLYMVMACKYQSLSAYFNMYNQLKLLMLYKNSNSEVGNCILEFVRQRIEIMDKDKLDNFELRLLDMYIFKDYSIIKDKECTFGECIIYPK